MEFRAREPEFNGVLQKRELVADVVAAPFDPAAVKRTPRREQPADRVGELDLAAFAAGRFAQRGENFRGQNVARGDRET